MITVGTHALERYRQRVDPAGTEADLSRVWAEATPFHPDAARLRRKRRRGVYRLHPAGFWLIAERRGRRPAHLITILTREE